MVANIATLTPPSASVGRRVWRLARIRSRRNAIHQPRGDRPSVTHGVQSGDVSLDSGVIWSRTDRPSRMLVEIATSDSFRSLLHAVALDALPDSDFTAKVLVNDLPAGQDIFYRVQFQNLAYPAAVSEPVIGRFRTAPRDRRSVSFVWSGDTAGQGWGIDESRGGMRTYATMLRNDPDFFIHSGDSIYADCPIERALKLPNGETWTNEVTEEKSRIAQSLQDYRGNYKYNLLDRNLRAFNAAVPTFAQWDDHEVADNWWPGQMRRDYARSQRAPAGGARPARVRRIHADARDYGRRRAASTARSRTARWSIFSCSTCAATVAPTSIT